MILATLAALALAQLPDTDCAHPINADQRAVCAAADEAANAAMAAAGAAEAAVLDAELDSLYRRAIAAAPRARRVMLVRQRRDHAVAFRACAGRGEAQGECQRDLTLGDIAELRRTTALAPAAGELSSRPIRYRCDAGYPDLWLTFFRTEPAQAWLATPARNEGQPLVLPEAGHVYRGRYDEGESYDLLTRIVLVNARVCRPAQGIGQWPADWAG